MTRVVAVTGATGFIGTHLVRRLAGPECRVRVLVRRIPGGHDFPLMGVEAIIGDLRDAEALRRLVSGADAVVHLAGLVKAPSARAFAAANVTGTRALVEAVGAHSDAKVIHVSSLAAREPGLSDYARSKNDSESEISRLSDRKDWIIIRPPVVYGPADRETLAFFRCAKLGFSVIPGPRDQRLSFIYINDLVEFLKVNIEKSRWSGQTLEIDDGTVGGYQWPGIVAALSEAAQRPLRMIRLPAPGLRLAACLNAALHRAAGRATMFTPGKARELLHADWAARPLPDAASDWSPVHNLVDGFEKTMRWYRLAGWL